MTDTPYIPPTASPTPAASAPTATTPSIASRTINEHA